LFVFLDTSAKYLFESEILNSSHVKEKRLRGKGSKVCLMALKLQFLSTDPTFFFLYNDLSLLDWEPLPYAGKEQDILAPVRNLHVWEWFLFLAMCKPLL